MVSIAASLQEWRSSFRQKSVRVLVVIHCLQGYPNELDVSNAVKSGRNGEGHVAWPDCAISLGPVDDCGASVRECPVIHPPGAESGYLAAGVDGHGIGLNGVCT